MVSRYAWGERLPTLSGAQVRLRWLTPADVPALYEVFSDEEVNRYWDGWRMRSLDDAAEYLADIERGFRNRTLFQWGIAGATGRIVGTTTLLNISDRHRRAEIGFAIGRAHWGQGLAVDAASTTIRFAFEQLDLHRIEADADPRNIRSLRLLEKLGFRREGLLRQRYLANGELQDAVVLGLLRSDRAATT
jgi:RimJ/RimL family protein N-acetyltransferase